MSRPRGWRFRGIAITGTLLVTVTGARAEEPQVPPEVVATLRAAAREMAAVRTEWTSVDEPLMPFGEFTKNLPDLANAGFWEPVIIRHHFDVGRYRFHVQMSTAKRQRDKSLSPETTKLENDFTFDGENLEFGVPGERPRLTRRPIDHLLSGAPDGFVLRSNYWEAAGWKLPDAYKDHALKAVTPLLLYLLDNEAQIVSVATDSDAGSLCLHVTLQDKNDRYELWLDPTKGYCTHMWELRNSDGDVIRRSVAGSIQKHNGLTATWLPDSCKVSFHQFAGVPAVPSETALFTRTITLKATKIGEPLDSADLQLQYPAGAQVVDDTKRSKDGEAVAYRVPASPADLDAAIERANQKTTATPIVSRSTSGWARGLLVANVIVIIVVAILIWTRIRRRAG